ncbi:L-ascorbic acid binding [Mactra antiquata]
MLLKMSAQKKICSFVFLLTIILMFNAEENEEDGFCYKKDGVSECVSLQNFNLTRLDGGQVGDITEIFLQDGKTLQMETLNTRPLVFEIPDFLSDEECEHFINVANNIGMKASYTERQTTQKGISLMDINSDKKLSLAEMKLTIENGFDIYLEDEDVIEMYKLMKIDTNNDNFITQAEMKDFSPQKMANYLSDFLKEHPEKHSRYSKQAWLYPDQSTDEVFNLVQKRVSEVVQLPMSLIQLSDFQVVNYGINGHYNAHLDSSHIRKEQQCCDRGRYSKCRICRYMTILFYLNDVDDGGETAFPFANKDSINHTNSHLNRVQHLYKKCHEVDLRVPAEKRKAIIWYNHFIDESTGWMGDIDEYTLHGGCPVKAGEKWIANFWIKTNDEKSIDLDKIKNLLMK